IFSQVDWAITPQLHVLPGLRYNYDRKNANFDRKTYIENNVAYTEEQLAAVSSIYAAQQFHVDEDADNFSGQLSVQYKFNPNYNAYITYSKSYKPVGINVGGLPTTKDEDGNTIVRTDLARVRPESVNHYELGL